jgi:circadian clock protein KaiC
VLDDKSSDLGDVQLHSIAHGVIALEQELTGFGSERRRLHVVKMRGMQYRGGYHDFKITHGGLCVYPRLVASEHHTEFPHELRSTGSPQLDALLGGGLVPGTATLLNGVAGVGKTTTAVQCLVAALERGERGAYFLFDERLPTLLIRSAALGLDLRPHIDSGALTIRQIDPSELSPGEFAMAVKDEVQRGRAKVVLIDSINAYLQSMRGDEFLVLQMHELLSYMSQQGVIALLILGQHGIIGDLRSDVDLSYLADTVIQLRFFEAEGQVRQAMSVLKTRTTQHERTIREFQISGGGVVIGPPLQKFQGVLTGAPVYIGQLARLMASPADEQLASSGEHR